MANGRHAIRVEIAPRTLFIALGILAGVYLLIQLRDVAIMVVVALVLVGTIQPLVAGLEKRGLHHGLALAVVFVAVVGSLVLIGVVTVPPLLTEIGSLIERAPSLQADVADHLERMPLLAALAAPVRDARFAELLRPVGARLVRLSPRLAVLVGEAATVVVLAFYLIADRERARAAMFALVPGSQQRRFAAILPRLVAIVGGYMRGQLVTSALITGYAFLLLTILRVPGALALAVLAGLADVLPLVGGLLATAPAVLVAFTESPQLALIVLVAMVAYQVIENKVLVPHVYGRALRLPSAAVILALLVGGTLLGIPGAFLALPIAAGMRVVLEELRVPLPGERL